MRSWLEFTSNMATEFEIRPEAAEDLDAAFEYYESKRSGLGDRFLAAVRFAIHSICITPGMGRLVTVGVRRVNLRKWPYAIFYKHDPVADRIDVHCVFQTAQHPSKWQVRFE